MLLLGAVEFAAAFGLAAELPEVLEVEVPEVVEFVAEAGLVAELSEPLACSEGEVVPLLLAAAALLLGLAALFGAMLLELLVVEPLVPESWANATGAKAATDNAKPAPSK